MGTWVCPCHEASPNQERLMYTLIVVDMQPGFKAANNQRVRANCLREIQKAQKEWAFIIFLEIDGYQNTHYELVAAAGDDHIILLKNEDDGSEQVERDVRRNNRNRIFKVCGINTDCCVQATVRGLTTRFPMSNIDVISDACDSAYQHQRGLQMIKSLGGRVNLV